MSLITQLQAKGVKVYQASPLWINPVKITTVEINDNCVITEGTGEFAGVFTLAIQEGEERVYIPLAKNTTPDQPSYDLCTFTAARDWSKWNVIKGAEKVFAV